MKLQLLLVGTISLLIFSCNSDESSRQNKELKEDVSELKQKKNFSDETAEVGAPTTFNFNEAPAEYYQAESDIEIVKETGTKVSIPAQAFVHKDGRPVEGEVEVVFNEYHSAGDIIASGIPMNYDSAGIKIDFESAGMFEIYAYQSGEELVLAKDKSIDVELASFKSGDFNFYHKPNRELPWNYLGNPDPVENTDKRAAMQFIEQSIDSIVKPNVPLRYSSDGKYFDLNIDYNHFSGFRDLMGLVWQYAGTDTSSNPLLNPKLFSREWNYASIVPDEDETGVYSITVQNDDTNAFTTARPVFRGKLLEKADIKFNQRLVEFNERMETYKKERERLERESDIVRAFSIKNMGIYNYDRQYKYNPMLQVLAKFEYSGEDYEGSNISVFLITGNGTAVVQYTPSTYGNFRFNPDDDNKMIAILPDSKVATFSQADFDNLSLSQFSQNERTEYTFKLKVMDTKLNSAKDIDHVLSLI